MCLLWGKKENKLNTSHPLINTKRTVKKIKLSYRLVKVFCQHAQIV